MCCLQQNIFSDTHFPCSQDSSPSFARKRVKIAIGKELHQFRMISTLIKGVKLKNEFGLITTESSSICFVVPGIDGYGYREVSNISFLKNQLLGRWTCCTCDLY